METIIEKFRVLVVDNNPKILELASDLKSKLTDLEVVTAGNMQAAEEEIRKGFFHAAFVDIELTKGDHQGIDLIRALHERRPVCERVIMTGELEEHWDEVFPISRIVDDALMKGGQINYLTAIRSRHAHWLKRRIIVEMDRPLHQRFFDKVTEDIKKERNLRIVATREEFVFLLSLVFGPLEQARVHRAGGNLSGEDAMPSPADIGTVVLKHMKTGKSGAVVLLAFPKTNSNREGIFSVIKIDTRFDAYEEYAKFRRFVRFGRRRDRHVDLLGHAFGDTMGMLCYSFAGSIHSNEAKPLEDLLSKDPEFSLKALCRLFDPEKADFYNMSAENARLIDFFYEKFSRKDLDTTGVARIMKRAFEQEVNQFDDQERSPEERGAVRAFKQKFVSPMSVLKNDIWDESLPQCIIHGDLHAGNVFPGVMSVQSTAGQSQPPEQAVASGESPGEVIMIDYFHTGPGPRTLDFAAMESSVRFATIRRNATFAEICARKDDEASLWEAVWSGPVDGVEERIGSLRFQSSSWQIMAANLGALARKNFKNHPQQLSAKEYAATCLIWIMRLFTTSWIMKEDRRADRGALLVWSSHVCTVLNLKS